MEEYALGYTEEDYMAVAWEGLRGAISWNNLSQNKKNEINADWQLFLGTNSNCK